MKEPVPGTPSHARTSFIVKKKKKKKKKKKLAELYPYQAKCYYAPKSITYRHEDKLRGSVANYALFHYKRPKDHVILLKQTLRACTSLPHTPA